MHRLFSHYHSGEFFLVSSTTVKARAFASGFAPSPVTSESYTLGGSEDENPGNAGLSGVQLQSPVDGEEVTSPRAVTANIGAGSGDATLVGWELKARLLDGDSAWQPLASGTSSGSSLRLGQFDPTLLLNGLYRLQVVGYYSNGSKQFGFHDVVVKGGMKIGHFTMNFADLTLPVAGIPVTVTRTYDSRDTHKGNFGIEWRLRV